MGQQFDFSIDATSLWFLWWLKQWTGSLVKCQNKLVGRQQEYTVCALCFCASQEIENHQIKICLLFHIAKHAVILVSLHFPSTFLNKFLMHIWIWTKNIWDTLNIFKYFRFGLGLCCNGVWLAGLGSSGSNSYWPLDGALSLFIT